MKTNPLIIMAFALLVLCSSGLQAQQVVASAGGDAAGSSGSVSYSVGQMVYTTISGTSGSVIQGVEQPYEVSTVSVNKTNQDIKFSISVFPNPTSADLMLTMDHPDNSLIESMHYDLFDAGGKLLISHSLAGKETAVNMSAFASGTYYLMVVIINDGQSQTVKTFQIVKH